MLSVGAIHFEDRFCASKKGGIGGGRSVHPELPCTWQLPWLAIEKPWSALVGPFLSFLDTNGLLCLFRGSISGTVGSFQSGEAFAGRRALTIVSLLMSGRGRGHEPWET